MEVSNSSEKKEFFKNSYKHVYQSQKNQGRTQ